MIDIENGLKNIIATVSNKYASLPILTHGYDYPRPLVGEGKYIGRHLRKQGFPDNKMQPIINAVINKLNIHIDKATDVSGNAQYINCRGLTREYTWYDDMHPSSEGYLALSLRFEDEMNSISNV